MDTQLAEGLCALLRFIGTFFDYFIYFQIVLGKNLILHVATGLTIQDM